ncbi:hypothetical protein HHK36_029988 [Tetracentron sinense]|uniref:Mediator of RNA polymerase II transcription subunit n=1 Tax=Tetracentron sinense TaxID=13715 RepID=A0A834YFR7_TETSI|nr:hypothetical protein HHK36_029988 [Tetracentron sinense]
MEATSPVLPQRSFSVKSPLRKTAIELPRRVSSRLSAVGRGAYDGNYSGRFVDENMIVLRKRIHEMKMVERNYEPPSDWMEWEKRYYTSYDSDICEAMGLLQSLLMDTRPCVALVMVALITLSVPASTAMILFHLMEILNGVLSRILLS